MFRVLGNGAKPRIEAKPRVRGGSGGRARWALPPGRQNLIIVLFCDNSMSPPMVGEIQRGLESVYVY